MAQSNGQGPRAGGHPTQQGRHNNQQQLDPRHAQQQASQPGNWQQQEQHAQHPEGGYPAQDPNAQQPGYQFPQPTQTGQQQNPQYNNAPAAPGGQPHYEDPNQYAPQFSPAAQQAPRYDETPMTGDPYAAPQGYPAPGAQQAHNPMDNPAFPQQATAQQFNQPDPNAHGYDAGGYAGAQPGVAQQQFPAGSPDYLTQPEYANQADPFAAQPGTTYPDDPNGHQGHMAGEYEQGYEDEGYEEAYAAEGSGGSSRMLMIAGALVGAIVIGGGLAYGWKMISGPAGSKNGETPVVRSETTPNKTRPQNPGGQQFDHANSKIMGRLDGSGAKPTSTDSNGTKKVPTISISRNGKIQAPAATSPTNSEPSISVPGLTVVDAFGAAQQRAAAGAGNGVKTIVVKPPTTSAGTKPRVQIRNAPKKPIVITKRTTANTAPTTPTITTPVKPKVTTAKKPAPPTSTASVNKKPKVVAKAPVTSATGSKGYVAVLASVPLSSSSRMSALMKYADLQQKYSTVLANKTPDVKEANLGAKGKYHRLLVGPPGSRAQASSLCTKLKSAGYSGCWVTAY